MAGTNCGGLFLALFFDTSQALVFSNCIPLVVHS